MPMMSKCQLGLTLKAVDNACLNLKNTKDIILHSDFETQYTGRLFEEYSASNFFLHFII